MRLFVAIHPPEEVAVTLVAALDRVDLPPHRRTPIDQVHLTALFIGERSQRELPDLLESLRAACAGIEPFRLRPIALTTLPERGLKRTVVLECDRPSGLLELHSRLVARCAREPRPHRSNDFVPHLTIARFPGAGTTCPLHEPVQLGDFVVREVRLMSSELAPNGARHVEQAFVRLGDE